MRDRFGRSVVALMLLLGLALATASALRAQGGTQSYELALEKFAADSYNDTDAAIAGVAASGNPLAAQVITALQDGRLLFNSDDKKIYIRDAKGAIVDAATGQPITGTAPANLKPVRVNNRIRRGIEAALGALTLMSPDPAKRFEAANAVFKSKDANQLATVDAALAKETDQRVKRALLAARAPRSGRPASRGRRGRAGR